MQKLAYCWFVWTIHLAAVPHYAYESGPATAPEPSPVVYIQLRVLFD